MSSKHQGKSKIPLNFKLLHTLIGLTVFFSLVTVPAEAQVVNLFGIPVASEFLWWPIVFFLLQLIHNAYGFSFLRHTVYLVILFHALYVLFLKLAIWLPSSSFWQMQESYTQVLGRDVYYLIDSSVFFWGTTLLPLWYANLSDEKVVCFTFFAFLIIFSLLNMLWISPKDITGAAQLAIPALIYGFLSIFSVQLLKIVTKIEQSKLEKDNIKQLFKIQLPTNMGNQSRELFKYHHMLFCSSIVFFIASKTMAAKFISIGYLTINVGGIVFSLAYLVADIMTDVYGIERTKQMV